MNKALAFACVGLLVVAGCGKKKQPTVSTSDLTPPPPPTAVSATPTDPYLIPAPAPTPAPAPAVTPAPKAETVRATPTPAPAKTVAPAKSTTGKKVYVVKKGDILSRIAVKNKTTVAKILALNPKLNPNKILVGQKIILP